MEFYDIVATRYIMTFQDGCSTVYADFKKVSDKWELFVDEEISLKDLKDIISAFYEQTSVKDAIEIDLVNGQIIDIKGPDSIELDVMKSILVTTTTDD